METIYASNVDQALVRGLTLLEERGIKEQTRAGTALVMPTPVMTANQQPMRRVSFNPLRDANPFFHLMEALWMLAGRNDGKWLDQFVGDFSKRFGEEDGHIHGAYGFRWRKHFDLEGGEWAGTGEPGHWCPDQLNAVVKLLKVNPFDRQVVLTMWDPVADLGVVRRDRPCNTHIYPRIREEFATLRKVLDLTVCCRSNDAIWGAHGSNLVHFSILQEYLAARIGVGVGTLYQLSNNYHAYIEPMSKIWPAIRSQGDNNYYRYRDLLPTKIVAVPDYFDRDLELFFGRDWQRPKYTNAFFQQVAIPLRKAYAWWRDGQRNDAQALVGRMIPCDWSIAAGSWFERRIKNPIKQES